MSKERTYVVIDLKSFYASVECIERGLDPLNTNLVVADSSRTEKTICLAVTPSLKQYGISGRARLFEVVQRVKEVNAKRALKAKLIGKSHFDDELKSNSSLAVDYLVAPPRMAYYMQYSAKIYSIYLKYVSAEDIHVYSVDEVFIDVSDYLNTYKMSAKELTRTMILDVLSQTGITATAGIGSNMYLCKIALDIGAKKIEPDENGVRIAELTERSYRETLWDHTPLTDFWRVGRGYAKKLEENGMYTMGDVARCSLRHEELLYRLFGVNAELLIDHAWGWEPCTIEDIRSYRPDNTSLCSGQVLEEPYTCDKTRLVVKEMTDALVLDLVDKRLMTDQLTLTIGYDINNLGAEDMMYDGDVSLDRYGRRIPKHAHGTATLSGYTSSTKKIIDAVIELYDRIIDPKLFVRRINISANRLLDEKNVPRTQSVEQLDIFSDVLVENTDTSNSDVDARERKKQEAMLTIKKKYGKNAIIRGMNLEDGATAMKRNKQIGGHKA